MRRNSVDGRSFGGYTLLEMMIAVAIISILLAIVSASYETLKARIRYSQVRADLNGIVQAAYTDYTSSRDNTWAPNVLPIGTGPSFVGTELKKWPQAPCPQWFYSWDNYAALPPNVIRITIHHTDGTALWSYCLENYGNDCLVDDGTGTPINIATLPSSSRYIYCSE